VKNAGSNYAPRFKEKEKSRKNDDYNKAPHFMEKKKYKKGMKKKRETIGR
jgi:hypothetical protein